MTICFENLLSSAHSKSRRLALNADKLSQWVNSDSGFNAKASVYHGNSERMDE